MLVTLLCNGVLEYGCCVDLFGISRRQFQRDVKKIRTLGRPHGFAISHTKGGRVFLSTGNRRVTVLSARSREATATLARLAAAFGGPIAKEMRAAAGELSIEGRSGFLHVREPSPSASDRVTQIFDQLKAAAAGPARVEFAYTSARGIRSNRRVEPYYIVARSGRYYLVAYDLARRDWRYFALDAIRGPVARSGTFTLRPVPERFLAERAVGWMAGTHRTDVTIHVSPIIAAAVCSRIWQQGQQVRQLSDGGAELTLCFEDLAEAVRWTLQFGAEAAIVGPPEAVALAAETTARIAATYATESRRLGEGRRTA